MVTGDPRPLTAVFSFFLRPDDDPSQWRDALVTRMSHMAEMASRAGVRLVGTPTSSDWPCGVDVGCLPPSRGSDEQSGDLSNSHPYE